MKDDGDTMTAITPLAQQVVLTRHPDTPDTAVRCVEARVQRSAAATLALTFALQGDIASVRVPPPCPPRWAICLWEHTCFEAFVLPEDGFAYHEFNFGPSGEWAAFAFERYRDGAPTMEAALAPGINVRIDHERLELDAIIHLDRMQIDTAARLRLALCAVVENQDGALSYWALRHPPGKPDFHHSDGFTLRLGPSTADGPTRSR